MTNSNVLNPDLMNYARTALQNHRKVAFVDPAMAGGMPADPAAGGGMPMDPAAGGGMPMDPAAGGMPMDPAMAGGAPPAPPAGGGLDVASIMPLITEAVNQAVGASGAGAGAGAAPGIKPKIDVNVAIMQMSKILARIADAMGIQIPASEMIATPQDLGQMATQQQAGQGMEAPTSSIAPIEPIQGAMKTGCYGEANGEPYDDGDMLRMTSRAQAVSLLLNKCRVNES